MQGIRSRALHIGALLILLLALGASAYPGELADRLDAAATAMRAGRPELALPALEDAMALEPEVPGLALQAAIGSLADDKADQATSYLQIVPEGDPRLGCLRMEAKIRSGMLQAAAASLADSSCPEQAEMLSRQAELLIANGDYESAEKLLQALIASSPSTAQENASLGLLLAIHDPERALSYLRLALDLDPTGMPVEHELMGTVEGARNEENVAYTLAQVGQVLARAGQWPMAATAFQNALAHDPGYTEARAYYGLALDRSGEDGLAQLQLAAAQAPQAPLPLVLLGKHWLVAGEPARAVESYEQAAALAPDDPLIAIDLGAAYAAVGDLPAAKAAYQFATQLQPRDATFWSLLAQFSLDYEIELAEVGLPAARQALKLQPHDPAALDRLGYTHFLLGNWTLAERFILEAIRADGNLASAHYHHGLLAISEGDMGNGRRALARAAALDPEGRFGNLALRSLENLNQ